MKGWFGLVLAVLFSGLFLYLALRGLDWNGLWVILKQMDLFWILPLFLSMGVFVWLTGVRWNVLLAPQLKLRWRDSAPALMAGFAGNNLLPFRLGEVLRVVVLSRSHKLSLTGVTATVIADRLLDVLAVVWLSLAVLPFLPPLPKVLNLGSQILVLLALGTVIIMFLFVWRPQLSFAIWNKASRWLPDKISHQGDKLLEQLVIGMEALRSPIKLSWIVFLSLLKWLAGGLMVYFSLIAVGRPVPFQQAILALSAMAFLSSAPSLPGFIGVTQIAFSVALVWLGTSNEQAIAASVIFWLVQWLTTTIAGGGIILWYLMKYKKISLIKPLS